MYLSVYVQNVSILHKTDLLSASFLSPRDRSKMINKVYLKIALIITLSQLF